MRRTWEWFQARAASRHAKAYLAVLSFTESSFFLIPPDVLLIPMLAAGAGRWLYYAFLTTASSVLGAIFGYVIAAGLYEVLGAPIVAFYHLEQEFAYVGGLYEESTFWVVLMAAFTPIPFKVFVLAGGFFGVPFLPFLFASILGRGARFYLVAFLAHRFGPRAAELFLLHFKRATVALVIATLLVGLIWLLLG